MVHLFDSPTSKGRYQLKLQVSQGTHGRFGRTAGRFDHNAAPRDIGPIIDQIWTLTVSGSFVAFRGLAAQKLETPWHTRLKTKLYRLELHRKCSPRRPLMALATTSPARPLCYSFSEAVPRPWRGYQFAGAILPFTPDPSHGFGLAF